MRPGLLLALVFAALALLAAILSGVVGWALMRSDVNADHKMIVLFDAAGLSVFLFTLAIAWAVLQFRLIRPLNAVTREVETLSHARKVRPIEIPEGHATGALVPALHELVAKFIAAREDTQKAIAEATARGDSLRHRLEAILLDLSEGVIVCNLDHRILLYNHAAARILNRPAALGLGRSLFRVIQRDAVAETLDAMLSAIREYTDSACPLPLRLTCRPVNGGSALNARLAAVLSAPGVPEGYVLTLAAPDEEEGTHPLPPRPEFYDFDLFARTPERQVTEIPLKELRCVVFDTETTGLSPSQGDELVSIGAVRITNGRLVRGETFEQLINPGRTIPKTSIRFHGITDDMVKDAPGAAEVLREFRAFTGNAVLIAHNAAFDMKFLKLKEKASGVAFTNPVLDVLLLSAFLHDHASDHSLDATARRFAAEVSGRHSALGDAMTTAEIFLAMLDPLKQRGVETLGQALEVSSKLAKIRRQQAKF